MRIEDAVEPSEQGMKVLEVGTAYFLMVLFAIGFIDLLLVLAELLLSGEFTDPNQVIDIIDTVLVLLIIVEIHQTVVAFSRNEPVVRIVISAALIAITRKVISFRPGEYASIDDAFVAATAFSLLLAVLVAAYFVVRWVNTGEAVPDPFADEKDAPGPERESVGGPSESG